MLLIIDNYDSFTFNLYQIFASLHAQVEVVRNDYCSLEQLEAMQPDYLVVSPGPGKPENAGISIAAIQRFAGKLPILGVCLGHQAITMAYGGKIIPATQLMHGKSSTIKHLNKGIFQGLPQNLKVMRYHSLIADSSSFPAELEITAATARGEIMALAHRQLPIFGVQFHPEAYLTEQGKILLNNFLNEGGNKNV